MTREARTHERGAGIAAIRQHAHNQAPVAIDLAAADAHTLIQDELSQQRHRLAVERLALLGCVHALEAHADRPRLASDEDVERVAIRHAGDPGVELPMQQVVPVGLGSAALGDDAGSEERRQRENAAQAGREAGYEC